MISMIIHLGKIKKGVGHFQSTPTSQPCSKVLERCGIRRGTAGKHGKVGVKKKWCFSSASLIPARKRGPVT